MTALLEVDDITLRFGGVTVLFRGLRPRTPSSPGSLALAPSTGDADRARSHR